MGPVLDKIIRHQNADPAPVDKARRDRLLGTGNTTPDTGVFSRAR